MNVVLSTYCFSTGESLGNRPLIGREISTKGTEQGYRESDICSAGQEFTDLYGNWEFMNVLMRA
jgi:hypothetical protein